MTLTIYGTSRSRAFRVLWAAQELALPFEHAPLPWETCAQDPAYLVMNPAGAVPCIRDGDFVLAESLAINLYLANRHGRLWPVGDTAQALALQWSFWAATSLEEPYIRWALHTHWLPEQQRNPIQRAAAAEALARPLSRLELALADRAWLVEDTFTMADLNVASVITLLHGQPLNAWPGVNAWLSRCVERPAFKQAALLP